MREINIPLCIGSVLLVATCAVPRARPVPFPPAAPTALSEKTQRAAWDKLKGLAGQWRSEVAFGREIAVSYALISKGSALAETYVTPSGTTTMTVYHPDGTRLVATHYCAQGNQPRLIASSFDEATSKLVFDYFDATNLASGAATHMTRLAFTFSSDTAFTQESTYEEDGKAETDAIAFRRDAR